MGSHIFFGDPLFDFSKINDSLLCKLEQIPHPLPDNMKILWFPLEMNKIFQSGKNKNLVPHLTYWKKTSPPSAHPKKFWSPLPTNGRPPPDEKR